MKIREKLVIPENEILSFLHSHRDNHIQIDYIDEWSRYHVTYETEYTEAEFNMKVLHTFQNENVHGALTTEEKNAIDYAIGAIKTLADMGVLK